MSMNEKELKETFEEIKERINKEMKPFLDGVRTKQADYKLFKRAYKDFLKKHSRALDIARVLIETLPKGVKPTKKFVEDLMELFTYMGLVESMGNSIVNIVVMLLVANGRDFHIECRYTTPRIKHAVTIKDLEDERVPLATKLNFLRDNGITELTSIIDSELRNKIAHLGFDVTKDRIYIKGKPAYEVASDSTQKLLFACVSTLILVSELKKHII